MKFFGRLLALLAVLGLVVFALLDNQKSPAPSFVLQDLQGQRVNENLLQGRVTLINFWYPSCPGCVIEMPKLIDTHHKFAHQGYQTLAIALPYNTDSEVREYVKAYQLPFVVAIDATGDVGKAYKVQVAPNSFLIDSEGRVIQSYLGEPNWAELHNLIQTHLPKP